MRVMISSGVVPVGGVFSSGPSWATKGRTASKPKAKKAIEEDIRNNEFMNLFYRITGACIGSPGRANVNTDGDPPPPSPRPAPLHDAVGKWLRVCRQPGWHVNHGHAVWTH